MIRFEGVRHAFGSRAVLRGVDLDLPERRIGIIGANGSGKSTLARTVNGLVRPDEGRVVVDGLDVGRDPAAVRRRVGFVFSDPDAQIVMPTVAEDVAFSLRRYKLGRVETERRVREVLDRFGLDEHRHHPAARLSNGQKQLLALAAVLVTEPTVLVCDEPTTFLDRRHSRRIAARLAGLEQQVVLVTHQLDLLETWDRVVVVDEGRVVADGPPRESIDAYIALMDASC